MHIKQKDRGTGMLVLDYSDRRPIYEQIVEKIQDLILRGGLEPDSPLPSVRQLAMDLSINPNTIQRAYQALEREGWIYSVRGKGSFAAHAAAAVDGRRREVLDKLAALAEEAQLVGVSKEEFLQAAAGNWEKE